MNTAIFPLLAFELELRLCLNSAYTDQSTSITAFVVEQIPGAIFQGGGLQSITFVIIYQNVCLDL